MLWSYAKLESSNSVLFKATANSFVGMNDLNKFKPQEVSNIMWSYATAGEAHPKLLSKLGDHIVAMKDLSGFLPQNFSKSWQTWQSQEAMTSPRKALPTSFGHMPPPE